LNKTWISRVENLIFYMTLIDSSEAKKSVKCYDRKRKKKETKTNKQTSDQRANVVAKFEYRNDFPMI